jgi:hypothetical protein
MPYLYAHKYAKTLFIPSNTGSVSNIKFSYLPTWYDKPNFHFFLLRKNGTIHTYNIVGQFSRIQYFAILIVSRLKLFLVLFLFSQLTLCQGIGHVT